MIGQEHCDGCVGCLALCLQWSIPPVTMGVSVCASAELSRCLLHVSRCRMLSVGKLTVG